MRGTTPVSQRLTLVLGTGLAAMALLSGCVATDPQVPAPTTSTTVAPSSVPSATPSAAPTLDPKGDAEENLPYFKYVVRQLLDKNSDASGRQIIDHLVSAGFDKAEMEVTKDKTAIGLDADNIQFSVRMNGTCLIGQSGNVGTQTLAAPILATGKCMVGDTRRIDW